MMNILLVMDMIIISLSVIFFLTMKILYLIKPEKYGNTTAGCYGGTFVKIDENRTLFIYSSSQGIYNIHTIYYANYE
ncbi:hypothetical protein PFDG_04853 [Plasmodium falciparum Dd2]|uniref:Cysteine-rich protective antigen 6 bladed domain-containing protein n=1 Tax=Plasmodium falciparum (isolate Dd2) TaxID=57267 RepID=A0A0L7M9Q9_PLAF4|nr:hypothetical protein PFDG_04853 [Plasmodium falciparum Dd2]